MRIRQELQSKGLERYFEHVFGGDAFERRKPDPLPLLKTCEALGSDLKGKISILIYLVGIAALIWAPETKGQPLPED